MQVYLFSSFSKSDESTAQVILATDLEIALEIFFNHNPKNTLLKWDYKNITPLFTNKGFIYQPKEQ